MSQTERLTDGQLDGQNNLILCQHNIDTLNIDMKKFGAKKLIIDKMRVFETLPFFPAHF